MKRTVTFVARGCAERAGSAVRLVGMHDLDRRSYWFYMTNATPDALGAGELTQLYVCRRQIGLVFKELKSHYWLGELPTRKAPVVEVLLLSSIMSFLLSRRVLDAVRSRLRRLRHRLPQDRWTSLFDTDSVHILTLPTKTTRALARRFEPMLLH